MLVQTLNAIALRFQNRHRGGDRDPLAILKSIPCDRSTIYFGVISKVNTSGSACPAAPTSMTTTTASLYGKAVPAMRTADSRSKFLEAYHNLLYRTSVFYHEDADTTVIADGFPLLIALREVHLLLAEGAHNQFGDLPGPPEWRCSSSNGCWRDRKSASFCAAAQWFPTRKRGWARSTR